MVGRKEYVTEKSSDTGIDPGTVRLVAQRLNHYVPPQAPCSFGNLSWKLSRGLPFWLFWSAVELEEFGRYNGWAAAWTREERDCRPGSGKIAYLLQMSRPALRPIHPLVE